MVRSQTLCIIEPSRCNDNRNVKLTHLKRRPNALNFKFIFVFVPESLSSKFLSFKLSSDHEKLVNVSPISLIFSLFESSMHIFIYYVCAFFYSHSVI